MEAAAVTAVAAATAVKDAAANSKQLWKSAWSHRIRRFYFLESLDQLRL
jgi:translation elongation factor EF-G